MSDQERDDIPMLLRNIELPRFPRSTSMCMPVRDEDYEEDTYVPHTGPLSSQPSSQVAAAGNPFVVSRHTPDNRPPRHPQVKQVSKPQAVMPEDAGGNRWSHGGDIPKNEHLMMSGPLGQCDNPDCVHCPPVCKNKRHFQRAPNHFDNKDKKCIVFNWKLATGLAVVRSVSDAIYFLHMLLQFRLAYVAPESRVVGAGDLVDEPKKIAVHYLRGYFLLDFFVVLPLPQVIILAIIPRSFGLSTTADDAKNYLRVIILLQYVPRIIRFVPLLGGRQSATGFIFESAWANFVINLLMFVLAGHVVGSCWYLFGLQRVNQCLQNACSVSNIQSCKVFRDCGLNFNTGGQNEQISQQWVNDQASTACFDTGNDTNFQYGIYQQAVLLSTKRSAVTRYVYSLFWGFQQISTLAGNLIPSYFEGEVLFTMAIVGLGLLLFALLIGNMQNFLQALGSRKLEMQLRRRDVEQWMSHRRLPEDLRRRVRHAERFTWAATQGVNEEELLSNLPEDIQRDIRRHFFRFLNKVRLFTLMDWPILDAICDKLRQNLYISGSDILYQGGPVDKMIFIVRGKLESISADGSRAPLQDGDVCGEELLTWYLEHSSTNKDGGKSRFHGMRLVAIRTVRCLTNVEAFVLRASDLEQVTGQFARFLRNPRVQGAIRYESPYWRTIAAARIQVAWRYRKRRLKRAERSRPSEEPDRIPGTCSQYAFQPGQRG
ncbi:hypothetical protein ACQJBY_057866 [Aegilops geniculata]